MNYANITHVILLKINNLYLFSKPYIFVVMDTNMLFSIGLNLTSPWKVVKSEFRMSEGSTVRELHIWIDFERGAKFMSSKGTVLSPHDTVDKEWRHLNFFEHPCYLHARVPRLKTDASSIEMANVPWARSNSGFTL